MASATSELYKKWQQQNQSTQPTNDKPSGSATSQLYQQWRRYDFEKNREAYEADIQNRMQGLQSRESDFLASYNARAKNRNPNSYVADSREWYDSVSQDFDKYDTDAVDLMLDLKKYADFYDQEYIDSMISSIQNSLRNYRSIKDYAEADRNYYSQWENEEAFQSYIAQMQEEEAKKNLDLDEAQKEIAQLEQVYAEYDILNRTMVDEEGEARLEELRNQYGYTYDLESLINEKKAYLNQAKHIQEGMALAGVVNNADFNRYDNYVSTQSDDFMVGLTNRYGMGYDDLTYEYINDQNGLRDEIKSRHKINTGDGSESYYEAQGYDYLTEDEIAIYNYYYAKEGKEKADEYLTSIQETLNQRKGAGIFEPMEDQTLMELAFGVAAGLDQFESGMKNLLNFKDDYIPVSATQYASGMVREDLKDVGPNLPKWLGGGSVGQMGYDTITTSANMAPSILTSMAIGMLNPAAGQITGTALMGGSAAGNAYQEMLNLGYDKGQARVYSALVGGSEAGLQYLLGGIGKLGGKASGEVITKMINGVDNAFLRTAIKLGGNMLSEGVEEGLQEILTPMFQNLVMHSNENVDFAEVAYSTLLGALTAGFMEGGSTIKGEVDTYNTGRQLQEADISAQRLAEIGSTFSADTVAYQLAGRVDENTGAYTMGRLFNEIGATMTEQNVNDITEALVKNGVPRGIARENAKAMAIVVEGGNLTDRQVQVIEANEPLAEAVRTTIIDSNATWFQRTKGYNEALMALAQEKVSSDASRTNPASQSKESASAEGNLTTDAESGKHGISEALEVDTSPAVAKSFTSIKNGQATIKLEDDTEISAKYAELDPDEGVRIETIASIDGISVSDANYILNTLRSNTGASAQMDALGAKEAYKYGLYGLSKEHMTKYGVFANSLTEAQRQAIYEAGQKARAQQVEAATPKKGTGTTKKTGIYFDNGNGDVVAFKDAKKITKDMKSAGVKAAMVLNKLGIGGDIYFFESYLNEKGQRVYKNKNGKEVKAPNGWYSKDGSIHIDLNAGNKGEGLVLFTLSHELTHFIEQWSPQKYKILADFLVENYEKEQSMDKLVRAKQATLSASKEKKVSYREAYSEVVADSMEAMLADGNVLDKLIELKAKDNDLFMKMKQFFDNLVAKIRNIYKGQVPDTEEGRAVMEMTDAVEKIQQLFADALVDASENFQLAGKNTTGDGGVQMMVRENTDIPYKQYLKLLNKKPIKDARKYFYKVKDARIDQYRTLSEEEIPDIDFLEIAEYNKVDEGYVYTIRNYDKFNFAILGRRAIRTKYDGYVMEVKSNGDTGETAGKGNDGEGSQHEGYETGNRLSGDQGAIQGDAERGQATENADQERSLGHSDSDNGRRGIENSDGTTASTEAVDVDVDANTESVAPAVQLSERTWTESDYVQEREKAAKEIAKAIGVSEKKAKAYIDSVNSIAKMIAEDRTRLDYFSSPNRSSFVGNVEYGGSFDFSTLCKKRRLLTGTFTAIQKALPNTALTANEILYIRNRMKEAGLEVSCGLCYVEGSRANMGQFAKEFLRLYKQYYPDAWQPNMADVNTPEGIEWVRINHPEVYEQYEYFWNHYGTLKPGDKNLFASQQKPKLYQLHTEYKGEILQKFKDEDNIEAKNLNGGIRLQSFSDFEIVHLIDTMQIIMDMSRVGLAGQAYTKVPDFAWALGDTGLKINLSLIAKGVDENGKLIFDDVEGMPIDTAVALRNRYSKNVGTILVAFNDEQLMAAMADDRVDFIIPFHRSQWKKSQYTAMGLPAKTKDYTFMQNEKFIKPQYHEYRGRMVKDKATNYMPNEYWDFSKSGKENAEAYLEMCARNNKRPKFYKLLQNNGDGSYSLKADGSTDGYWKLLIDFKMYDNEGNGSPQMPVRPEFNMDEAQRMLNTYQGGHSNFPVAQGIVDDFVNEYKDSHGDIQYSDRVTDSVSNRSLLANALEGAAQNEIERNKIQEYKGKIDLINAEERKLHDLNEKIKELSFAKGPRDTSAIRDLQIEARQTANRINIYDKQLLRLEASKPLQNVLEREKKAAYKKAEQKGKEALAAYKEKALKTQREITERYQESRKKGIDSRRKTAMRHKIKDVVNELNQYLLRGTKDRHVPIELQKAVAEALDAVNMDTVGAEERIAKLKDDLLKAKTPEQIQEISRKIDHIQEMGDKMNGRLKKLKEAYDQFVNSDDPMIANSHDEVISNKLQSVIDSVGNTPLRDMTLTQLEDVYDMYRMVLTTIQNTNKAFKAKKSESISALGNQVMMEVEKVGGKKKRTIKGLDGAKGFAWNNLKPVYAFEHIGSETLTEIFDNVRAGEDVWAVDVTEAREYYLTEAKKCRYDSWDFDKRYTFTSTSGMTFELSLEQIMSLYAYSKRDQAADHLKKGGIVIDESTEITVKTKLGIPVKFNPTEATAYNISDETLADIVSKLSPEQKGFVDEMQDYLSTVMGAKGNEVSLEMYGVKLFKEKFYFPLKSAQQFMAKAKEQAQGEVKIKNSGFSKETVQKASNPIVLTPFMNVWANHVNEMSMYHAFVLPMEDFYRVYSFKTPTSETMATKSVEMFIQNAYGKGATKYIDQLLKDLNGGARTDSTTGIINKMMGLFKKGAVFASLSVVVQQPSAIARAAALVDTQYFIGPKVDKKRHKVLWEEVKKYAPVAIIKEMGYFDTNMGKSTQDFILGKEYSGFQEKMSALVKDSNYRDEILSKAPALADELAWCFIWEAVKREVNDKYPKMDVKSEAFLKKVGERFTEVIVKTQVYDSVLSRSGLMRSKDTGMKMATAFMAEPTTSINMVADALLQGKRGNRKYARTAIGAVVASQIFNSILVSFVYAGRDDDEDKTYLEKYIGTLTGEVLDSLNPATYIPFIKDIVSIVKGYDVERSDMAIISDLWNAWQNLSKDSVSTYRKVEGFAGSIAQIFGLPVKNIMRDARGIYQTIMSFVNGQQTTKAGIGYSVKSEIPEWLGGGDVSNQNQLYEAILSGDATQIARVKSRFKDQSAINSAIRKALRENDPRIKEAAEARFSGDFAKYKELFLEIRDEGYFDFDTIMAAVNAEVNVLEKKASGGATTETTQDDYDALFDVENYYTAVVNNDQASASLIYDELVAEKVAEGYLKHEAEDSIATSFTTQVKNDYLDGEISRSRAVELLTANTENDETKVMEWDFQLEHGFSWSERVRKYRLGQLSEEDLISAVMAIEGESREGAEAYIDFLDLEMANDDIDITASEASSYFKYAEPAGIDIEVYLDYKDQASQCEGEKDSDGNTISGSKKAQILVVIDSMPISIEQKDALYFANGWAESKLDEAPWH